MTTGFKVSIQQAILRAFVLDREMRHEPIEHHLADLFRRALRQQARVREDLQVLFLPADLAEFLDQDIVVAFDRGFVLGGLLAAFIDRFENRADVGVERGRGFRRLQSAARPPGVVSPLEMKP